jgi:hypothetical protein
MGRVGLAFERPIREAPKDEEEEGQKSEETVSGDASFVAQGAESLDATSGEIMDHLGVVGSGS